MEAKESIETDKGSNDHNITAVKNSTTSSSANPTTTKTPSESQQGDSTTTTMGAVVPTATENQATDTDATSLAAAETSAASDVAGTNQSQGASPTVKEPQSQNVNASLSPQQQPSNADTNSGNDQVTLDKFHEPLVPSETSSPSTSSPTTKQASSTSAVDTKDGSKHQTAKADATKSASNAAAASPKTPETPSQPDEQTILEEAIKKERAPLVDRYSPFIVPSDTNLEDARSRLRIAIEQTRQLRSAFTERVYGKYRVCLIPPSTTEGILTKILIDPKTEYTKLSAQIKEAKAEKEIEKKEAQKLNAEMVAANTAGSAEGANAPNPMAAMNAENAEQLMYISAGLSAIILPEQDVVKDNIDTSSYPDRAPVNPETGQRVRSISAAAAAAGEVMLDRARKAAAMRAERHRRKQLQLKAGNDGTAEADNNYSRLLILSNSPSPPVVVPQPKPAPPSNTPPPAPAPKPAPKTISATTTKALLATKPFKKPAPPKPAAPSSPSPASAKVIRARVQASMSLNMLLSLNPAAEDLDGKPSSATKAMLERGVAPHSSNSKTTQQRFRHPFPESLGGRRGALASGQLKKDGTSQETLLHPSYSSLALPPLPTARERRSYKPASVIENSEAGTTRANSAIRCVLDQFKLGADETDANDPSVRPRKRRITEISFLHGVRSSIDNGRQTQDINPLLAFNVLQAVGLIRQATSGEDAKPGFAKELDPSLFDHAEKGAMSGEDGSTTRRALAKLRKLSKKFSSSKRLFTDAFDDGDEPSLSRPEIGNAASHHPATISKPEILASTQQEIKVTEGQELLEASSSQTVVSIRGGGEVMMGSNDGDGKGGQGPGSNKQPKIGGNAAGNGGENRRDQPSQDSMQAQRSSMPMNMPTSHLTQPGNAVRPGMVWDDPSRQSLAMMNPRLVDQGYGLAPGGHPGVVGQHANGTSNAARNARMQGPMQSPEQFRHHSTANAIQLAHHLRHATSSMSRLQQHGLHGGGDLADYIGGLHSQPAAAYDWSTIGAASHSQLTALGIHPHRAAMMNFSVQDRTRALIAREQQNAAAVAAHAAHRQSLSSQQAVNFLGGAANHGYPPAGSPHFPHITNPAAAILNSSAALMGHHGMQQMPTAAQVQSAARMHSQQDQRAAQPNPDSKKDPKTSKASKREQASPVKAEQSKRRDQGTESEKSASKQGSASSTSGLKREATTSDEKTAKTPPAKKPKLSEASDAANQEEKRSEQVTAIPKTPSNSAVSSGPAPNSQEDGSVSKVEPPTNKEQDDSAVAVEDATTTEPKEQPSDPPGTTVPTSESATAKDTGVALPVEADNAAVPAAPENTSSDTAPDVIKETTPSNPGGLQFFVPPAPPVLPAEAASLVLAARCHEAIELLDTAGATCDAAVLIDYLLAVGSAVPIPKVLVAQPLKEKLATILVKNNPIGTFPHMSREAIVASVLLWLWRSHEGCFQIAFAKNGRIDVDHGCKWLINAAVDKAVEALSSEIGDSTSRAGSQLTAALLALRTKGTAHKAPQGAELERLSLTSTKLDLLTTSIVGRELMAGLSIDSFNNSLLPHFDDLLTYLDDTRKYVLYSKSQERVFLANLISRKATMSLPFSHAYVSSMVRAGEALGHGELFEVAQNEDVNVSTNMPYDVFTDESGAWEDPCRPPEGYTQGLTGDDLMRRAHARAMIQKSLKKLQDRHGIRGGTSHPGPYIDPPNSGSGSMSDSGKTYSGTSTTPRGWVKRRSSFSEPPVQAGTGSAAATSWSLYDPRHYSAPLVWKSDDAQNSPYGRHNKNKRPRSLSVSQGALKSGGKNAKGKKAGRSMSVSAIEQPAQEEEDGMRQSTREIAWKDVANIFQNVKLPGSAATQKEKEASVALRQKNIFAPFVRKIDLTFDDVESESDDEEDLRDDTVLGRHQVVLDRMKMKLSAVFEARKKTQERRKSTSRDKEK